MNDNRTILYFLNKNNNNLLPADSQVNAIKNKDWYVDFKKYFNDLLWEYYSDRTVFDNPKFPRDNETTTINNIKKSIAIMLLSKQYTYENLYESTVLEFNPLWNVDGTETTSRTLVQTGTDSFAKSGTDTTSNSGDDVTKGQKTTYDTSFLDTDKTTLTHGLESETEYDSSNTETRNLRDVETITFERHGNIGVISTVKLLEEYRELALYDLWKYITHDIVNQFTYGIY